MMVRLVRGTWRAVRKYFRYAISISNLSNNTRAPRGKNNILMIQLFTYIILIFTFACLALYDPYKMYRPSHQYDWYHYFRHFLDGSMYGCVDIISYILGTSNTNNHKRSYQYASSHLKCPRNYKKRHPSWNIKSHTYYDIINPRVKYKAILPNNTIYYHAIKLYNKVITNIYAISLGINIVHSVYYVIISPVLIKLIGPLQQTIRNIKLLLYYILCKYILSPIISRISSIVGKTITYSRHLQRKVRNLYVCLYIDMWMYSRTASKRWINYKYRHIIMLTILFVSINLTNSLSTCVTYSSICFVSEGEEITFNNNQAQFDSDSVPIRIDNCCSRTISCSMKDFDTSTLTPTSNQYIKGFGHTNTEITHTGTIIWKVRDDMGYIKTINIPHSLYVPTGETRLLLPQHWAQETITDNPNDKDVWCATFQNRVVLHWDKGTTTKTIPINKDQSNTAIMWTIAGTSNYESFYNEVQSTGMLDMCFATELSDDNPIDSAYEEGENDDLSVASNDDPDPDSIDLHITDSMINDNNDLIKPLRQRNY